MRQAPQVGFVLEQTLGHVTHADNLVRFVSADERIEALFAPIDFDVDGRWGRVPGYRNWTVRAGVRARRAVRDMARRRPLDALFVHTQVAATLMPDVLHRIPTVVSLDATPVQYDQLGAHYGHATAGDRAEAAKRRLHRSCFVRARRLVTWSAWAKASLVDDYGIHPEKIVVIPPGVEFDRWAQGAGPRVEGSSVRVLFVGGDLRRKGGLALIDAIRRLRAQGTSVELDVVTRDDVASEAGITVHHGLGPNSRELMQLYWGAQIFCLPTFGDTLGIVFAEAGAARLPTVATDVGAVKEIVRPDETGLLVAPGDAVGLAAALERLINDPGLRRSLGENAQRTVDREFNAETNASRLVELLVDVARNP